MTTDNLPSFLCDASTKRTAPTTRLPAQWPAQIPADSILDERPSKSAKSQQTEIQLSRTIASYTTTRGPTTFSAKRGDMFLLFGFHRKKALRKIQLILSSHKLLDGLQKNVILSIYSCKQSRRSISVLALQLLGPSLKKKRTAPFSPFCKMRSSSPSPESRIGSMHWTRSPSLPNLS